MSSQLTLREAAGYVVDRSSPAFVHRQLLVMREEFSIPELLGIVQFVSLRMQELGIPLKFRASAQIEEAKRIFAVFPEDYRKNAAIIKFVAELSSARMGALTILQMIQSMPVEQQQDLAAVFYSIETMTEQGTPGSGMAFSVINDIDMGRPNADDTSR